MRHLDVFMDGTLAGEIVEENSGRSSFTYTSDYQASDQSTPLSLSMPIERKSHPQRVLRPFLQGLLADSEGRLKQLGAEYGVSHNNPIALLEHVGADAAGAIQILPHGSESSDAATSRGDVTVISGTELSELMNDLIKNKDTWGTRGRHGSWSLPGAQPKVALFKTEEGEWATPHDSTPTTHILKPSVPPYDNHHLNELLTMSAARALGLYVANDEVIYTESGTPVFVSERYDRKQVGGHWMRLHQEDMCQALSVDPSKKYQSDGGPGVKEIARILRVFTVARENDGSLQRFYESLCFNLAMQGTDAHAKNYSVLLAESTVELAPLYDLGSHAPYPMPRHQSARLAMSLGGEYRVSAIGERQLVSVGVGIGVDADFAEERARQILTSTPDAYLEAARSTRELLGQDPFLSTMVDAVADYASSRGWITRTTHVDGINGALSQKQQVGK